MTDLMLQRITGMYDKFIVQRRDGRDRPGRDRHGARYFVLDYVHDPHAIPAMKAYMESCREEYPHLAADLEDMLWEIGEH